ncbi:MAG TPA: M20/M25/M40 family metallo-hydrolase [Rhodanobacter sp.]|nr:M20/M25/M40 family metallo-hydrolase [Rhodanobacter sp.]
MPMTTAALSAHSKTAAPRERLQRGFQWVLWLWLAFVAVVAIKAPTQPAVLGVDAPAQQFSAARAIGQLAQFAQRPHPVGSAENKRVREHLLQALRDLGLTAHVEDGTGMLEVRPHIVTAGSVHNIVATLPGTANRQAVLLVAHYDSVPYGPGAGDDGAGVVSILETLRALKAGPALQNDVRVVFTDGEEAGLLGATAYVYAHPELARQVGVVMNFEGRGSSGPVIMFETSDANGALIRQLAEVAPYPVASSLTYSLYKQLPNDTDLTVFKRSGLPALNFAFIEGFWNYHSPGDTVAHLAPRTVQHMGSYALALTRHFGNSSFHDLHQPDQVFFNSVGSHFVHYPMGWVWVLLAGAGLAFLAVVAVGVVQRQWRLRDVLVGCAGFFALLFGVTASIYAVWWLLQLGFGQRLLVGDTASNKLIVVALVLVGMAAGLLVQRALLGRREWSGVVVGTVFMSGVLTALVCILQPAGSYLLIWPLLASLLGLLLAQSARHTAMAALWLALGTAPAVLLFAPMILSMLILLSLNVVSVLAIAILLGVLLGIASPLLVRLSRGWRVAVPALLVAALGCLFGGIVLSRFSADHPQRNTLYYVLDADHGRAAWISYDKQPHALTVPFLGSKTLPGKAPDFSMALAIPVLAHAAPALPLVGPTLSETGHSVADHVRTLDLHITSPRGADSVVLQLPATTRVLSIAWDGQSMPVRRDAKSGAPWQLTYTALPAAGVDLQLRIAGDEPVTCRLGDRSSGLPDFAEVGDPARLQHMLVYGNYVLVSRECTF